MIGDLFNCLTWNGTYGASTDQIVTATAVSAGSIDLLAARDIGQGRKLRLFVNTILAVTAAGAATVTFEVIQADDAALTDDVTVIGTSNAIGKALLVTGAPPIIVECNPIFPTGAGTPALGHTASSTASIGRRYLGCRFTVATGPLTQGTFRAYIGETMDLEQRRYPSGFMV